MPSPENGLPTCPSECAETNHPGMEHEQWSPPEQETAMPDPENDAPLIRTTYAVTVEHRAGEEPILGVSEGARITKVHRVIPPEAPSGSGAGSPVYRVK